MMTQKFNIKTPVQRLTVKSRHEVTCPKNEDKQHCFIFASELTSSNATSEASTSVEANGKFNRGFTSASSAPRCGCDNKWSSTLGTLEGTAS
ncbi:hypothetical protein QYF36_022057 [Acer negundo]|nr:hypothetical protein QYF36_022057 [Acer negundo]